MDTIIPTEVPAGYMRAGDGALIPVSKIKPEHLLEDELVRALSEEAQALSAQLATFRSRALQQLDAFLALLGQKYETEKGGKKGNFSVTSFDGSLEIKVAMGDFLTFGPELQVAKTLIDQCITSWSEGSDDNIKTIINDAFAVGKEGKLQVDRILGLRRLSISDPQWTRAMDAISDAIRVSRSKRYVRFYSKPNEDAPMTQVPLDVARV